MYGMVKIVSIKKATLVTKILKKKGKKVGFVTGCFDVIHISHIRYFIYAKKYVDILIVGVDNDESIRRSKGNGRPVFTLNIRSEVLSHLDCVDYIVPMTKPIIFGTDESYRYLLRITKRISPNFLLSNDRADKYWKNVKKRADEAGCGFIKLSLRPKTAQSSSTRIIERLQREL